MQPSQIALEGVELGGAYAVLYSPYAVGSGWEGVECPFSRGFAKDTSLKLGLNVLVYSMTH
jgi:hypothetical protein